MTAANSYANGASASSAVTSAGYTGSYSAGTWTIYSGFNITINAGLYAYEIPDTSALLSSSYNVGGIYYYYASATDLHEFFYFAGTNTASKCLRDCIAQNEDQSFFYKITYIFSLWKWNSRGIRTM
jgi:hypothetical protein